MRRTYAAIGGGEIPENRDVWGGYRLLESRPASWVRERTPSFAYVWRRCVSTVSTVTYRRRAISLFESPSVASAATRRSAAVSSPLGLGRRAPTRASSERACSAHPAEP